LASGFCPVNDLLQEDINVALGTDGAASNNDLDMTINGAKALGIDHITGSLTKGKAADVIAIDLDTIESQPLYDPISHIVYAANRNQVSDVWVAGKQLLKDRVAGKQLLKDRVLTSIEEKTVLNKSREWQEKIDTRNIND